ncbi:alpha/beta hydrolase [Variovorax ureilyticus]|uniref:Alpha/beta hydrolase n=1 Tax=Variovorax ureilyticus TaxID=1836198 RepID=A0ABU8VAZ8_9BURK
MKTSKIIAAAAVSLLAAIGAQAETYEGVQAPVSANSRSEVRAKAVVVAHSDAPYAESVPSRVIATPVGLVARGTVRNDAAAVRVQAHAAAHGQQLPL